MDVSERESVLLWLVFSHRLPAASVFSSSRSDISHIPPVGFLSQDISFYL